MPFPNEHAARLRDPGDFDDDSFRRTTGGKLFGRIDVPETVAIIWGKLKGKAEPDDPPIAQALRFPTKNWTEDEARKWLKDNEVEHILFEPATGEEEEEEKSLLMPGRIERRFVPGSEIRIDAGPDQPRRLAGYAAVFNVRTEIGSWFTEEIAPGAFRETIEADDVRCLVNHDVNLVLGRKSAGTLRLSEDAKGLAFEVDVPDTQPGRDILTSVERKDVTGASFGFEVLVEEFRKEGGTDKKDLRIIRKARVWDLGPVTFPAYEQADVGVRSHDDWLKAQKRLLAVSPDLERTRRQLAAELDL